MQTGPTSSGPSRKDWGLGRLDLAVPRAMDESLHCWDGAGWVMESVPRSLPPSLLEHM